MVGVGIVSTAAIEVVALVATGSSGHRKFQTCYSFITCGGECLKHSPTLLRREHNEKATKRVHACIPESMGSSKTYCVVCR
jgi:hypothetical protein